MVPTGWSPKSNAPGLTENPETPGSASSPVPARERLIRWTSSALPSFRIEKTAVAARCRTGSGGTRSRCGRPAGLATHALDGALVDLEVLDVAGAGLGVDALEAPARGYDDVEQLLVRLVAPLHVAEVEAGARVHGEVDVARAVGRAAVPLATSAPSARATAATVPSTRRPCAGASILPEIRLPGGLDRKTHVGSSRPRGRLPTLPTI